MQLRDTKTLSIDVIFPIVLIIVGLALATIAIFTQGPERDLSMNVLFPGVKNTFYYNKNAFEGAQFESDPSSFMISNFVDTDQDLYEIGEGFDIQETFKDVANITQQAVQFDDSVFEQVQTTQKLTLGQVYLQNLKNDANEGMAAILFLNATSQDIAGSYAASIHQAYLREYCNISSNCSPQLKLTFVEKPFPLTTNISAIASAAAGTTSAVLMAIAWLMMSDSLIQNVIRERSTNVKHQLMISGSSLSAYWLGHYIADVLFQALPSAVGIFGVWAFGIDCPQAWVLFTIHMFANPPFIYFLSLLFEKEEAGSLAVKIVFFLVGIAAPIAVSILLIFPNTQDTANGLRYGFYAIPIFSLVYGYISIANRKITAVLSGLAPDSLEPFDMQIAGPALYFLLGAIVFYWLLVVLYELKVFDTLFCLNRRQQMPDEFRGHAEKDEDVAEEEYRIQQRSDSERLPVRMVNLSKSYGKVKAVKNTSFGLDYGECFALLGVSGAGKTTCFKAMTGEIYPTSGSLTICGHDVTTSAGFEQARKQIGYCPQFDAIFTGLTVLEHLQIYAALKGIPAAYSTRMIQQQIMDMDLQDYVSTRANNLSGGNKRKLSVAMAMLGNPPLVFLDEPSTGVDPQAKRFMWNIVSKISTLRKKSAVIITTHSMEEAEALCTKMGIMVNGEFKCFGSSQHIKDKYGTGYELEIKLRSLTEDEINAELEKISAYMPLNLDNVKRCLGSAGEQGNALLQELNDEGAFGDMWEELQSKPMEAVEFVSWFYTETEGAKTIETLKPVFKEFEIVEHFGNSWKIKVSRDNYSIGYLFGMMEDIQAKSAVSEYSVAQTTLEQIFNNFALQAERDAGKSRRRSSKRASTVKKI